MRIEVCDQSPSECPLWFPHVLLLSASIALAECTSPSPIGWGIHPHLIIIYPPAPTHTSLLSTVSLGRDSYHCVRCVTCPLSSLSFPFLFPFLSFFSLSLFSLSPFFSYPFLLLFSPLSLFMSFACLPSSFPLLYLLILTFSSSASPSLSSPCC